MDHFFHGIGGWSQGIHEFYDLVTPRLPPRPICVEVGVYEGRSLAHLLVNIINRGDGGTVTAVDLWEAVAPIAIRDGYHFPRRQDFEENMRPLRDAGHGDVLRVLQMPSVEAAEFFADGSCDLIFLDADHSEAGIRSDIDAWWPKLKPGGIMGGHDYSDTYPDIVKVVREKFRGRMSTLETCWWTTKQHTPMAVAVEVA